MIAKAKDTPSLDDLLGDDAPKSRPRRRQTPDEQLAIAMRWNARVGGKVLYRDTA